MMVLVNVPTSWLPGPGSDSHSFDWGEAYIRDHYDTVGVADMHSLDHTEYAWGSAAAGFRPQSSNCFICSSGNRNNTSAGVSYRVCLALSSHPQGHQ